MAGAAASPHCHNHSHTPTTPALHPSSRPPKTPAPATMPSYFATTLASPQPQSNSLSHHPKTPSPNYFGFQANDGAFPPSDSHQHHAKSNWSPPSSSVRSTAAASPSIVPVDRNPDFDAFQRQSDGKAFNLGGLGSNIQSSGPPSRHKHARTSSKTFSPIKESPRSIDNLSSRPRKASTAAAYIDPTTTDLSRSPKRILSPGSSSQSDVLRKMSPATHAQHTEAERPSSYPRLELPLDTLSAPLGHQKLPRAETLPERTDAADVQLFVTPQHVINLIESKPDDALLLDLRVSTQYAMSHIAGALSLCIPTTLLKRPSFNVQKLAETFKEEGQRRRFEKWRQCSYIIVYDTSSAQLKDAQICLNTINKFQGEGFQGNLYIIKGGFREFSRSFSNYVENVKHQATQGIETDGPRVAPVIGGCPMPGTDKPANPFFGNIRQNMDLIGGVGQIALSHPAKTSKTFQGDYPEWLRKASDDRDQGKKVSNKFEAIERREKKRMEDALCGSVAWNKSPQHQNPCSTDGVRIAGIEKGNKNRYNNIWPFEHSRVRIQGVSKQGCDYFNASFIQASMSNKRYISTQAPVPETFNDFWAVVWQQDVRVIVMLTAEREGAQLKAHNYWDQKQYGPLNLEYLSEKRASLEPARIHRHQKQRPVTNKRMSTNSANPQVPLVPISSNSSEDKELPYVVVRKFTLSHQNEPFAPMREITHLQYSSWPDFGAPAHPAHLLGLVEQTDAVVRASNNNSLATARSSSSRQSRDARSHSNEPDATNLRPVMVHCSAGCGRTGTFCTVDSVIDMLKRQCISRNTHRGSSPMEIDETSPVRRQRDARSTNSDRDNDFFASQYLEANAGGVEGSWVLNDDLDLVEKTVEDFRHQRLSMVQSLRQYVLCYESVMEWLAEQERSPDSA